MPQGEDRYTALVEQTVQAHVELTGQAPNLTEHLEIQVVASEEFNKEQR